jgi:hypothetical protein
MSALEVLQHCPSQRRTLLDAIGTVDPESSNNIMFNLDNYTSRLSHQLAFQIDVVVHNQQIHRTILDEGASTCVMSLACWKGLKSPTLNKSPMMLRAFDGRGFHPHGILQSLSIQLGGKTITVDVEVVDAPLDYNLLLGRSWFYAMTVVAFIGVSMCTISSSGKNCHCRSVRFLYTRCSRSRYQQYSILGRPQDHV